MIYLMTSIMSLGKTEARARTPILSRHIAMTPLRAASSSLPIASFYLFLHALALEPRGKARDVGRIVLPPSPLVTGGRIPVG